MSSVINTNIAANSNQNIYNQNNRYMNVFMQRVATGMKVNTAKDNASVYSISERMRTQIRANDQANQNAQNDSALLKTAQGGISNTVDILRTLKERAINAANDSNVSTNRDDIATEVKQLMLQVDDNAFKVKFNNRAILNGGADPTSGATQATDAVAKNPNFIEPEAAGMPAYKKDGSTTGSHAVYKIDQLHKWNSSATTAAAATDKLTSLVKSDATSAADTLFKVGDKITFSWKEDGVENSFTYEVTEDSTVSNLSFDVGALHFYNETSAVATTALKSKDVGDYEVEHDTGTTADYSKVDVYNNTKTRAKVEAGSTSTSDLFAVGDYGVKITDFKIGVTQTDADGNDVTKLDAQKALKMTGVQQAAEYDVITQGTATAFKLRYTSTNANSLDEDTALKDLGLITSGASDGSDLITFKWGDGANDSITVNENTTLGGLQKALEEQGKSLRLNIVNTAGTSTDVTTDIKDADGNYVKYAGDNFGTEVEGTNFMITAPTSAATGDAVDLYFTSKEGVRLNKSDFTISATDKDGVNARVMGSWNPSAVIRYKEEAAAEEVTNEPIEIAPSTALSFHLGGEADFNINVTIDKMTVENLFAQRNDEGTVTKVFDENTFSDLFRTKEGAKEALTVIDEALNKALNEQTKLGAIESRLGYASDNITTMNENLEASDSNYRDSDIAKDMVQYMKYSVLSQAAQYMLTQSSQNAFQVLNLLQP